MCCRYWAEESPELREIVEEMYRSPLVKKWQNTSPVKTYGEIRPTDVVPVIAPNRSGDRAVYPMKWGYSGKTLLMNARTETAAEKPTFRDDWARHRCIVPASWYFEWEHLTGNDGKKRTGDKYMIQPKRRARTASASSSRTAHEMDSTMTWLCGLYRIENSMPVFVVLTREPGEEIRFIHDRMPLIMPDQLVNEWIRPNRKPEELLPYALTEMAFEKTK